ncbi:MAG: hypothetical protein IJ796_07705 [Lachnospiraceae bacterium]|nr:hypothetical protein [Lachnospiraceae bacterium]
MANELMMNKEKLQEIITRQDQIPLDLEKKYEKPEDGSELDLKEKHSLDKTRQEMELIDKILTGEYEEAFIGGKNKEESDRLSKNRSEFKEALTSETLDKLRHKKMLDQAHLLINEHSYKDSPEMKLVKADALNLAIVLEKNANETATPELLEKVAIAYSQACASCRYYLDNKSPTFKKGKIRKQMVRALFLSLLTETETLAIRRKMTPADTTETLAQVLHVTAPKKKVVRPKEIVEERQEQQKDDKELVPVKNVFTGSYDISRNLLSGKNKEKKAGQLKDLRKILKGFAPNCVEVADVKIMGKKVRLLQHSDNTLSLIDKGVEIPLELNATLLSNKIETAMMDNARTFGDETINELMDGYSAEAFTAGEHARIRTILSRFLAKKTGLVENDFGNTFKVGLVQYAKDIISGAKKDEQIKKEVIEASKKNVYVNGVALSEMVQINKNQSIDELRKMVVLQQKDKEEVIAPGWTKEEQDVKNMLADLVFTTETEEMDVSIQNPEIFMQHILTKHKSALLTLVSGNVSVDTVLNKMSIGELDGQVGEKQVKLSEVVGKAMNSLATYIKSQMARFEKGGDLANTKDIETDEKKLEYIVNLKDEATKKSLTDVKKELDEVVDESCQILQSNVTKMTESLFPEKKEKESDEHKTLQQMIDEASQSTAGMGMFMRTTLKNYFAGVSNMDKRAMIASVFRSAENVPDFVGTDEQLVQEIKDQKIEKYKDFFKDKDREDKIILSEADKRALEEYRSEKRTLNKQANFFAGLLRGAGPLLQKMMQAMDRAPLPPQILKAIEDMKSNLPPIPDGVVQAEFLSMVQSSGGQVTRIEQIKSLGAASVGQTFLCKVYGPKMPEGREVVIKLLRPDAKNRMQREESIMLECAKKTDKAMYLTYLGQLDGFKKELDLSIEANNCKEGVKYYEGKKADVETMKVFEGIPATNTSLVVEKAEGTNMASYIKELEEFTDKNLDELYDKEEVDGVTIVNKNIAARPEQWEKMGKAKDAMLAKIDEAVKRRDHLINLCNVWIDQAIMKDGFYHGDLHAGNIMITDEKATFIDYGNTTQLTEAQKLSISRMVVATQGSINGEISSTAVDLFFESFNDLLADNNDEEFLSTYTEEKKTKLKEVFTEVLKKGTQEDAGKRIYVALLKAQELQVKMPSAIQGFIEGQVRLQNTINRMNDAISKMKNGIDKIENSGENHNHFDAVHLVLNNRIHRNRPSEDSTSSEIFRSVVQSIKATDKETFKAQMLDKTYVEANEETGAPEINKRAEFKNKYYDTLANLKRYKEEEKKLMGIIPYTEEEIKNKSKTMRQAAEEFFKENKGKADASSKEWLKKADEKAREYMPYTAVNGGFEPYGGQAVLLTGWFDAFEKLDKNALEKFLKIFEEEIPVGLDFVNKMDRFFEYEDESKIDEIYESFTRVQKQTVKNHYTVTTFKTNATKCSIWNTMEKDLSDMFAEKQDGLGAKLKEKYDVYVAVRNKTKTTIDGYGNEVWSPSEETQEEFNKALNEMAEVYQNIATIQLEKFEKLVYSQEEPNFKFVNFDNVLMDVVEQNVVSGDINSFWGKAKTAANALALMNKLGDKATTILKKMYM